MPFWMKSPDKGWILTWNYLLKFGQFGWNLDMVIIPLFIYVCLCSVRYRELRNLKLTFSTRNCIFYESELGTKRPCLVLSRVNTSFCPNNMSIIIYHSLPSSSSPLQGFSTRSPCCPNGKLKLINQQFISRKNKRHPKKMCVASHLIICQRPPCYPLWGGQWIFVLETKKLVGGRGGGSEKWVRTSGGVTRRGVG